MPGGHISNQTFLFIWRNIFAFCFEWFRANIWVQNRFYQLLEVKNTLINSTNSHVICESVLFFIWCHVKFLILNFVYSFSPAGLKYFIIVVHRSQSSQLTLVNLRRCSTNSFQIFMGIWTKHCVYYCSVIHRVIYITAKPIAASNSMQ